MGVELAVRPMTTAWRTTALGRPAQFMLLAFLLATANSFAATNAASLFLSRAGADALPGYYLAFAALSIPMSLVFSAVIDRWPRATIMRAMLIAFLLLSVVLAALAGIGEFGPYALYLGVSIGGLLLYSVYYVLAADYFTATEAKRHTGAVAISMAAGGLAGAILVAGAAQVVDAGTTLYLTPLLVAAVIVHLGWLTGRERPLDESEAAPDEGVLDSLTMLPRLARRYPIIPMLGTSMFVAVLLQCLAEYLAFSIYADAYPQEEALTAFLGLTNAGLSLFGIAAVFFFTNPLIPRLGVARMNVVFPLLNLGAFALLSVSERLPAGILAHVAYDPCDNAIGDPVTTMNFNAVPHRFVARVRVVHDGVVYPAALALAGILLLVVAGWLERSEIALLGLAFSVVLVAVHVAIGRQYVRALVEMLRGGSVDLEQVGEGLRLPAEYVHDIRAMLESDDAETVALGLEMAARCDVGLVLPHIERVLPSVSATAARAVLGHFAQSAEQEVDELLGRLAMSAVAKVRARALETIAVRHGRLPGGVAVLMADGDATVRAIAAAACLSDKPDEPRARAVLDAALPEDAASAAINVLRTRGVPATLPMLRRLGRHGAAAVRAEALTAVSAVADAADRLALDWADFAMGDHEPRVRAAAIAVLARLSPVAVLGDVAARGFNDPMPEVRLAAAAAIGARGDAALPAVEAALQPSPQEACDAAIEAIGVIGGRAADDILFRFLDRHVFPAVAGNLRLAAHLGSDAAWRPLRIAVADANSRAIHLVLASLAALGYRRTLNCVRTMLSAGDARQRSNAVETLASLAHRRYVLPLMAILEPVAASAGGDAAHLARQALGEALEASDPYLRAAAVVAWAATTGQAPQTWCNDPAPIVNDTARALCRGIAGRHYDEESPMNRLVFLKSVPLFSEMSLDNLVAVDGAMRRETYLAAEPIVVEGDLGDRLFIVFRGEVAVTKRLAEGERELARLGTGQVFGEMSLFDDEPRSATVAAVGETEVLALERERFHSLVQQKPQILMAVCKVLVDRLRKANR